MSFGYRDEDWIYPDYEPAPDVESCIEVKFGDPDDIVKVVDGDTGYTELEFDEDGRDARTGTSVVNSYYIEDKVWEIIDKLLPIGPDGEFVDGEYQLSGGIYFPYELYYNNNDENTVIEGEIENDLTLTRL